MQDDTLQLQSGMPQAFRFAGARGGIKSSPDAKDVCLIVSDSAATAVGVYTQNLVVAAPVALCRERTPNASARAVVANSGNANACTGAQGATDAHRMSQCAASSCRDQFAAEQVLVMSTGVIGRFLPMECVESGIAKAANQLADTPQAFIDAADAILTTDKARKIGACRCEIGDHTIRFAAMAKGAGMIGPKMATMLGCIVTDASLSIEQAHRLLARAADASFNCISVEGHTSTNDTLLLLANGASGASQPTAEQEDQLAERLTAMCIELAKQIPADGEGAAHLIEIVVTGAANDGDAQQIARTIAASNLVKTAVFGNDPNWGRIVSAAGYAGPEIEVPRLRLSINGICLFDAGEPVRFDRAAASHSIRDHATTLIELTVGKGMGRATHWTSDLSVEYVRFNAEYTT